MAAEKRGKGRTRGCGAWGTLGGRGRRSFRLTGVALCHSIPLFILFNKRFNES